MISLITGGIRNSRYHFLYNFMKILSLFVIPVRIYIYIYKKWGFSRGGDGMKQ